MLLKEEYKDYKIQPCFIHYLKNDEKRYVLLNPFLENEIKELIQKVKETLKSNILPKTCSQESKCKNCNYCDECNKRSNNGYSL